MYKFSRFTGNSMHPTLKPGDVLFLRDTPLEELRRGDVIIFRGDEKIVCHRFFGSKKIGGQTFFLERGDNVAFVHSWQADRYLSKVEEAYRGKEKVNLAPRKNTRFEMLLILCEIVTWLKKAERKLLGRHVLKLGIGWKLAAWRGRINPS
ncbi:MAG: signal peptidase I [Candidatus Margulisiibacteriota bacterium]